MSEVKGGIDYALLKTKMGDALEGYGPDWGIEADQRIKRRLFWRDRMETSVDGAITTCKWAATTAGMVLGYINTVNAFEGDYVLSASHATERYVEFEAPYFGSFDPQKLGFEVKWFKRLNTTGITIGQFLMGEDPDRTLRATIRWTPKSRSDGKAGWSYRDVDNAWQDVPNGQEQIGTDTWNYLKIITDWLNETDYRLQTTKLDIDLSSYSLYTYSSHAQGRFQVAVGWTVSSGATLPYANYIDDARIYLNDT